MPNFLLNIVVYLKFLEKLFQDFVNVGERTRRDLMESIVNIGELLFSAVSYLQIIGTLIFAFFPVCVMCNMSEIK